MQTITVTAHVYDVPDLRGDDFANCLWDIGSFLCLGDASAPHRRPTNTDIMNAIYGDQTEDAAWKDAADATPTELEIYEYDYGVYCETNIDDPEYIAWDDIVWYIDARVAHPDDDDDTIVSLVSHEAYSETRTLRQSRLTDLIEAGDAVPLLNLTS